MEEARELLLQNIPVPATENIPFTSSANRVLAQDICADDDIPAWDKSAMDGFACKRTDLPGPLRIIETIPAGKAPLKAISVNECSKIMTGAPMPQGADCVVPVEEVANISESQILFTPGKPRDNIRRKGEDVKKDEIVIARGRVVKPQDIAVMATVGASLVTVAKQPVITVLSTGNELVEPNVTPALSQIRNSNSYQLIAQCAQLGIQAIYGGILPDDEPSTLNGLTNATKNSDLVLLSGGVSMGEFDFVPLAMEKLGFRLVFDSIAVQPGRPTTYAVKENKRIIGLPGNPVSSFIQFELLVSELIVKMMGGDYAPLYSMATLSEPIIRKRLERDFWTPVIFNSEEGSVCPVEFHGSAHLTALSSANGLCKVPAGVSELKKGSNVIVRLI